MPGEIWLLSGWCQPAAVGPLGAAEPAATRAFLFAQPFSEEQDGVPGRQRLPAPEGAVGFLAIVSDAEPLRSATLDIVGAAVVLDADRVELVDAQTLAWIGLGGIDAETRSLVAAFAASAQPVQTDAATALALATHLALFHEAVRVRHPHCTIAADCPSGLFVGSIHRMNDRSFYIKGWMRNAHGESSRLVAIAPEGARVELTGQLFRFPRIDVEQFYGASAEQQAMARSGFLVYCELGSPSRLRSGWALEMSDCTGETVQAVAPEVIDDLAACQSLLLADLVNAVHGDDSLLRDHIFPALTNVQQRRGGSDMVGDVLQYGTPPAHPEVSIIVPLYQRIDFVEHQMAQWCLDEAIRHCDLIYVLDSPELADALRASAEQLFRLYGIAFRTVMLRRNVGFAHANNAGASIARGRMLLLLNSDVLPRRPGWLATMVDFYDRTPGVGAIGAKLIYEDDSIQHAGMYFVRDEGSPLWENAHYFKGLHRTFAPANVSRIVPAVTGACLLLSRRLWDRVGGLKGTYIQGDYEDSDLCLRLADLGYDSWYLADVELYHLEGQSYASALRRVTSQFNTWLHSELWTERIADVMQKTPPADSPQCFAPIGAS